MGTAILARAVTLGIFGITGCLQDHRSAEREGANLAPQRDAPRGRALVCENPTLLSPGTLSAQAIPPGATPPPRSVCRRSNAAQVYYRLTIPPRSRATITASPRGEWSPILVIRAFSSCEATACDADAESPAAGQPVSIELSNSNGEPETRVVSVSSTSPSVRGEFDLALAVTPIAPCDDPRLLSARYEIRTIPFEPGGNGAGRITVNDAGHVAVQARVGTGTRSFFWVDGVATDLGTPDGSDVFSLGINNRDEIVGWTWNGAAFVWRAGVISALPRPVGSAGAVATDINDAGVITGRFDNQGRAHLATWANSMLSDYGEIGPSGSSEPVAINESGQIAGFFFNADFSQRGFFWDGGRVSEIGPEGAGFANVTAMNNAGEVVGQLYDATGGHAYVWRAGTVTLLPRPDGHTTSAAGINDHGQIVGTDIDANQSPSGFLFGAGVTRSLLDLVPPGSGWSVLFPSAISNCGHIVGFGFGTAGVAEFVMTPVIE